MRTRSRAGSNPLAAPARSPASHRSQRPLPCCTREPVAARSVPPHRWWRLRRRRTIPHRERGAGRSGIRDDACSFLVGEGPQPRGLAAGAAWQPRGVIETRRTMLSHALRRRCPLCGTKPIFDGYFNLRDRCPGCNFSFEREEGYWVGAMIANIAAAEALFAVLFIGGIGVTYPDVPWTQLGIASIALMFALPILFYP